MRKTVKILMLAAAVAISAMASAQTIKIPGTEATLTLTEGNWSYLRTFKLDDGADIYIYYYSGKTITGTAGDTVLPCLRIYVNKRYSGDLYSLVYERYMAQPYQSLEEYMHGPGLPKSGGLGYVGAYTNPTEHRDYELMMTYFKSGNAYIELRLETTADTFAKMKGEFTKVLNTLK